MDMETITIPKKLSQKGDLVVLPRKEYEELLRFQRKQTTGSKKNEKFYAQLDRDLKRSIKDYRAGKYYGPFKTVKEGKEFLASRKRG